MSQRDLVAELRAAHVTAPAEVRERVRLVVAQAPRPQKRFTWRRFAVVLVPVAAAIAASVVFTMPSGNRQVGQRGYATVTTADTLRSSAGTARALSVPSAQSRVQVYGATLGLRVQNVSNAIKDALRIAASLSGYPLSVHARDDVADLKLKVPRARVQEAIARLSKLGTIASESVDIADKTVQLNATDRAIARLRAQLATAPPERRAGVIARIEALQRQEAATRRAAHFASISLHLAKTRPAAHRQGPLHGIGVALRWLGIGAIYALAVGGPVAVLLALVYLAVRIVRRRREDALLSSS